MASLNKVQVIGHLGADPELRYTQSNVPVATLSVATTEKWKDRDGNPQEETEWHRIVVWNKQAENCAKYLSKGRPVYVEGKLKTRSWDDKQTGQKRYATEIVAQNVQFLGSGQGQGNRAPHPADEQQTQQRAQAVDQQMQGNQQAGGGGGNPYPQNSGQPAMPGGGQAAPGLDEIPF